MIPRHLDSESRTSLRAGLGHEPSVDELNSLVALFSQGRYREGETRARAMIIRYSALGVAWKVLGGAIKQQGRTTEALAAMQRAADLLPGDIEAHGNLAIVLHELGRLGEAEASYRRALELGSDRASAHNNLGAILRDQGRLVEALDCFRRALALQPSFVTAWSNMGHVLRQQGRLSEAEVSYRQAVALMPGFAKGHGSLGLVLWGQGRLSEAEASYCRALALQPNQAETLCNLGLVFRDQGRLFEAEASQRRALALEPDFALAHGNLAVVLRDQGRLSEAEVCCRRALELDRKGAAPHNTLSLVYQDQGRYVEAEACLRRALAVAPGSIDALVNLGAVLPVLDRQTEAEACFHRVLALLRTEIDGQNFRRSVRPSPVLNIDAARQALCEARSRLLDAGIPFFLCHGTLLGIVRNGDLLPHDKDLDVGLPWEVDRDRAKAVLCRGGRFQRASYNAPGAADAQLQLGFRHQESGTFIDLFFYRPDGDHFVCGFNFRPHPVTSRPRKFGIGSMTWLGLSWPVPDPVEQFLVDFYGEDWRVPDPAFDTVLSSRCRTPESCDVRRNFGYLRLIRTVRNREWGKAAGYCRQLLVLRDDATVRDFLPWVERQQTLHEGSALHVS